jgi:ubiquitin-protein ligase
MDKKPGSQRRTKRIITDLKELEDCKDILAQSGIHFYYDDNDISKIFAMLIGPDDTPYEKGFYFFEFNYPLDYPMIPPVAKYLTQGTLSNNSKTSFQVRFNPNLYINGKVCLSMLNTWNGPGWVPTNTMSNVLVAIQALVLNNEPLRNEPGYEHAEKEVIDKYSSIIAYANIKISVFEMILKPPIPYFQDKLYLYFLQYKSYYRDFIIKNHINNGSKKILLSSAYTMNTNINYEDLLLLLDELEFKVNEIITVSSKEELEKININDICIEDSK